MAVPGRSSGRVLFDAAAQGGAQAAGRDSGRIAAGAWADLVAVSTDNDRLCGRRGDRALDTLIFAGQARQSIRDVWSAGRPVVRAGRHVARDRVSARFRSVMTDLGQDI